VKLPRRVRKEHVYLSHTQVDKLAEASGSNALVVRILSYTGLRWGELAGLHIGDVDLFRRRLTVNRTASLVGGYIEVGSPKDYERRSVPFPPFLANALTKQCSGKPPSSILFPDRAGGYRRTPTVHDSSWYDSAKLASGLPASLTIHDLRHTAASLAISAGANVKAVQHMLGHASAAMTLDTYADLFPDDLDDVSIALDKARTASVVSKMCPPSDPMKEQKTP
jgi:integrase